MQLTTLPGSRASRSRHRCIHAAKGSASAASSVPTSASARNVLVKSAVSACMISSRSVTSARSPSSCTLRPVCAGILRANAGRSEQIRPAATPSPVRWPAFVGIDQRQQRLGEPGEIPLQDVGLVAVGIPPAAVDGAVDGRRIVLVHECARPEVDRLARHGHVVGVHHAVDEADLHPARDERTLPLGDGFEQGEITVRVCRAAPGNGARWRSRRARGPRPRRRARRSIRTCRCGCGWPPRGSARLPAAGRLHGVPARRWSTADSARVVGRPERVHRLADQVFAQDGSERRAAIAAPRERRRARAFPLQVAPFAVARRPLRRSAARGRRRVAGRTSRTGGRRRPSRAAARPPARLLPAQMAASSASAKPAPVDTNSPARLSLNAINAGAATAVGGTRAWKRSGSAAYVWENSANAPDCTGRLSTS